MLEVIDKMRQEKVIRIEELRLQPHVFKLAT
jgi:hypothetical protein